MMKHEQQTRRLEKMSFFFGGNHVSRQIFYKSFLLVIMLAAATATIWAEHPREDTEWVTAYWYNANDNQLPRVLLIGDSICNGYQAQVRNELAGTAFLGFYATSKCVTDRSYLKELKYILEEYDYAVIHFNNGLHSLNTDPEEWEAGLRAALQLIREKSKGAKIVWATSTPLKKPELTAKVQVLNAIAAQVMRGNDIPLDDLFSLMVPLDRERFWTDTYHYNNEAKTLQAKQVAASVRAAMGVKTASTMETADKVVTASATANNVADAVSNPGFESLGGWMMHPATAEAGEFSLDAINPHGGVNAVRIEAKQALQFYQAAPKFKAGTAYVLKFWARSEAAAKLAVHVRTRKPPYQFYGNAMVALTPEWQEYSMPLTFPADYQPNAHNLFFNVSTPGTFWLDDIAVTQQ